MSIFNQLVRTTARIETVDHQGTHAVGTGFFVTFDTNGSPGFLIVSNRHVLEGKKIARVGVTNLVGDKEIVEFVLVPDCASKVISHPDPTVDLAALGWGSVTIVTNQKRIGWLYISETDFLTETQAKDLTPFESLVMIGYPNGLWDSQQNIPILRSGDTATPLNRDFLGKRQFLINAPCFAGSSGSPVFVANEGAYSSKEGITFGSRCFLAGVLTATYTQSLTGSIEMVPVPSAVTLRSVAQLPLHLGICIKAVEIQPLIALARARALEEKAA